MGSFDNITVFWVAANSCWSYIRMTCTWPLLAVSHMKLETFWWQIYGCIQTVWQIPDIEISAKLRLQIAWCCLRHIFQMYNFHGRQTRKISSLPLSSSLLLQRYFQKEEPSGSSCLAELIGYTKLWESALPSLPMRFVFLKIKCMFQ